MATRRFDIQETLTTFPGESAFVWVLNADAEIELSRHGTYEPTRAVLRQMRAQRAVFAPLVKGEPTLFPQDLSQDGHPPWGTRSPQSPGRRPRALFWSPTQRARRIARGAGLDVVHNPSQELLQRVFHRQFLGTTGCTTLPGRQWLENQQAFVALLNSGEDSTVWRLKRAFGFAGRGQLRVQKNLSDDDARWVNDSLRQGGFLAEPECGEATLVSIHGMLLGQSLEMGTPCLVKSDARGAPTAQESWTNCVEGSVISAVSQEGRRAGEALIRQGYLGPFGLDLLLSRGRAYAIDLNPRFTLAWSLGMGPRRDELLAQWLGL